MKRRKQGKPEDNVDALIGANVRKFREMQGLGRHELAELFHITEDVLYRIERGQTGLSGVYAYILANELNCDMNFIYGRTMIPQLIETEETDESRRRMMARMMRYFAGLLDGDE